MNIALGSDHAGWKAKEMLKMELRKEEYEITDIGTQSEESVDYPDFAYKVAQLVASGRCDRGILICATGIGVSICANKIPGIRAAVCHDEFTTRMSRQHNNANILCLGARVLAREAIVRLARLWLKTQFDGGRHQRRIDKIHLRETNAQMDSGNP